MHCINARGYLTDSYQAIRDMNNLYVYAQCVLPHQTLHSASSTGSWSRTFVAADDSSLHNVDSYVIYVLYRETCMHTEDTILLLNIGMSSWY